MIRSLRPTDIVAILASGRSFCNYARTKDCLGWEGASVSHFPSLIGQFINIGKLRYSWVWIEKNKIQGLVSIQKRWGRSTWEISSLRLAPNGEKTGFNLLDALGMVSGRLNITRFFLRLSVDSNLMEPAKKSGFTPYARQRLYRESSALPRNERPVPPAGTDLHLKRPDEDYKLFQTYNRLVPEPVRRAEGLTFEEWQESRENAPAQTTYLCEREGQPVGWVNITSKGGRGCLEIFTPPDDEALLKEIFFSGLARLPASAEVYCLALTYQTQLCHFLEDSGFALFEEHGLLAREQFVRVEQPYLAPARL